MSAIAKTQPTPATRSGARAILHQKARDDLYIFYMLFLAIADPSAVFISADVHRGLAFAGMEIAKKEISYLLLAVPPRHGKSIMMSVMLVAWMLGRDPTLKILCASYGDVLASQFARLTRTVMESPLYRTIFPETVLVNAPLDNLRTTKGGCRDASSVLGPVTGFGYHVIIIDDPLKAGDAQSAAHRQKVHDWISGSLMSRFEPNCKPRMMIVMQRLHQDDPIGRLKDQDKWDYYCWPARATTSYRYNVGGFEYVIVKPGELLYPEGFTEDGLQRLEQSMGPAAFNAQYLQKPESPTGNAVKRKYFRWYEDLPRDYEKIYQSWDVATTTADHSAWSVCITFMVAGQKIHIVDVWRRQVALSALPKLVHELRNRQRAEHVYIEADGIGHALLEMLSCNGKPEWLHRVYTEGKGKEERLHMQIPKLVGGRVLLPREASWLDTFLEEVLAFPLSRNADQVDALTQFLRVLDFRQYSPVSNLTAYRTHPYQPF